jgi:hypothetical protein
VTARTAAENETAARMVRAFVCRFGGRNLSDAYPLIAFNCGMISPGLKCSSALIPGLAIGESRCEYNRIESPKRWP